MTNTAKRNATRAILLSLLIPAACHRSQPSPQTAASAEFTGPQARHAVQSRALQSKMMELSTRVPQLWPQEVQQDRAAEARRKRRDQFQEAKRMADLLRDTAEQIKPFAPASNLSETEQAAFVSLADQLARRAGDLSYAAWVEDFTSMQRVMDQITATCNNCHTKFRAEVGALEAN